MGAASDPQARLKDGREAVRGRAERALGGLYRVMARLREPGGCPWDREQTPRSLLPYLLEETYEVVDAVEACEAGRPGALREELGDLLFQVLFHADIQEEAGAFDLGHVIDGVREKLVFRHPHVFGDASKDRADISRVWDEKKREERESRGEAAGALAGVPRTLPALARAQKIQDRASRVGFDWPTIAGVWAKLDEETAELREAEASGERPAIAAELGDLLFTAVNLARFLGVDAEDALRQANGRFTARFTRVESLAEAEGKPLRGQPIEQLEALWRRAKRELADEAPG